VFAEIIASGESSSYPVKSTTVEPAVFEKKEVLEWDNGDFGSDKYPVIVDILRVVFSVLVTATGNPTSPLPPRSDS
jgi:hypothetical protein